MTYMGINKNTNTLSNAVMNNPISFFFFFFFFFSLVFVDLRGAGSGKNIMPTDLWYMCTSLISMSLIGNSHHHQQVLINVGVSVISKPACASFSSDAWCLIVSRAKPFTQPLRSVGAVG